MEEWSDEAIAYHEAGHAVAHSLFGFHNDSLSIVGKPEEGCAGFVVPLESWQNGEGMQNYIISCFAGYAAQCRFDPVTKAEAYTSATHDFDIARKILRGFGMELIEADWISKAEAFVEANWTIIEAVAKEALIYQELDYDEIDFIVEITRASDQAEAEELRNGLELYRAEVKRKK
jgi:hypothetical protein